MKKAIFISLIGLSACSIDPKDPNFLVPHDMVQAREKALAKAKDDLAKQINFYSGNNPEILCKSLPKPLVYYGNNNQASRIEYDNCEADAKNLYSIKQQRIAAEEEAKKLQEAEELKAQRQKEQEIEAAVEAKKREEESKLQELATDLKSGKKQPETLKDYMLLYDAPDGMALSVAPKIKPDMNYYAMGGTLNVANEDDSFIAKLHNDVYLFDKTPYYFKVIIPDELKQEYYDTAKIGFLFVIVGRYIENIQYTTVLGVEKTMPVFQAAYFKVL